MSSLSHISVETLHNLLIQKINATNLDRIRKNALRTMITHIFTTEPDENIAKQRMIDFLRYRNVNVQEFYKKKQSLERQNILIINYINASPDQPFDSSNITKQGIEYFFNLHHISYQKTMTKQKYLDILKNFKQQNLKKKRQNRLNQQQNLSQDRFGNQIINPVWGNDGVIYDRRSMIKYLETRPLKYQNHKSVPVYVIVGGSVPLRRFFDTQEEYMQWKKES